mgnify:CR=1 FL=1
MALRPASAGALTQSKSSPSLKAAALASLEKQNTFGDANVGNNLLMKIGADDGKSTVLCAKCWRGNAKTCRLHSNGDVSGYMNAHVRSLSKAALPHLRAANANDVGTKLIDNVREYLASKGKGKGKGVSSFTSTSSNTDGKGKGKGKSQVDFFGVPWVVSDA